tara:strand:- start:3032 stop:3169 length:138 start_codon:yes stop_codon:yes gene_type:complete
MEKEKEIRKVKGRKCPLLKFLRKFLTVIYSRIMQLEEHLPPDETS